ncbi:MAG: hypothetical protein K9N34_10420 [Candidatus Marinimicrobia bacterium]|nr:hypothetical protein [Candidatus Neomarinimicrobiota bacterium]
MKSYTLYKIAPWLLLGVWILSGCNHIASDPRDCWRLAPENYQKYARTQPEGEFIGQDYIVCLFRSVVTHYSEKNPRGIFVSPKDSTPGFALDTTTLDENAIKQILKPANWKLIRVQVMNAANGDRAWSFRFTGRWQRQDIFSTQTVYAISFNLLQNPEGQWSPHSDASHPVELALNAYSDSMSDTEIIEGTFGIYPRSENLTSKPPFHYLTTVQDSNVRILDRYGSHFWVTTEGGAADSLYHHILKEFEFMPFLVGERESFDRGIKLFFTAIDLPLPKEFETMNWEAFTQRIKTTMHNHWNVATCSVEFFANIPFSVRIKLTPKSSDHDTELYLFCEIRNQQWFLIHGALSSQIEIKFPPLEKQLFGISD